MMRTFHEHVRSKRPSSLVWVAPLLLATAVAAVAGPTAEVSTTTAEAGWQASSPTSIWPDLTPVNVGWLAAVAVLVLTFRTQPFATIRNLDALVLALMCLLVPLRGLSGRPEGSEYGWDWWSYTVLTATLVYWLLRGAWLVVGVRPVPHPGSVSGGACAVLIAVGLALVIQQVVTAPIEPASRDGIVGGVYVSETGQLPYGAVPGYDTRAPLLYYLHAGAVRIAAPTIIEPQYNGVPRKLTWAEHDQWMSAPLLEWGDFPAARLVNGVLLLFTLAAMYVIGRALGVESGAALMIALFCLFPGTIESVSRPDVMLPVTLLAWATCCAMLGGLGGLFATILLILAATSWPWAWLGLPILLAFLWRRGWQAFTSTVGLVAGIVLLMAGLLYAVRSVPPRPDGALSRAGVTPSYSARYVAPSTIVVEPLREPAAPEEGVDALPAGTEPAAAAAPASAFLWRWLLRPDARPLKRAAGPGMETAFEMPPHLAESEIQYDRVAITPEAGAHLGPAYRAGLSGQPPVERVAAALRTVLEPTWLRVGALEPEERGTWEHWGGQPLPSSWVLGRRISRVVLLLVVLWAALAIFLGRRTHPRHVVGGLLLTFAGAIVVSTPGAAANLSLLLPLIAAIWSVQQSSPGRAATATAGSPPPSALDRLRAGRSTSAPATPTRTTVTAPPPRITIETSPPAEERKN